MVATFEYGCLDEHMSQLSSPMEHIYMDCSPFPSPPLTLPHVLFESSGCGCGPRGFAGTAWSRLHAHPPMSQLYGPSDSLCDIFLESKLP